MKTFFAQPAVKVTLITAALTGVLATLKLVIGYFGRSHALQADGVHSVSDLLIDLLVIIAAHFGGKKADYNHPYGHGRIETAATFALATVLIIAGISIVIDAGEHVWGHVAAERPAFYVLWVALIAIAVNEFLFRYTLIVSKKIKSPLLEANAWHSRSDSAVSIVVLLSIIGALLGFTYLDAIGAIIVGIMIGKLGGGLAWRSISELVDTGVDEDMLTKIKAVINNVPGVCTLHQLRTRTINKGILVDVHILVSPKISVSEGHFIGDQVIVALYKAFTEITDITVHVDPEDDEIARPSTDLPNRETLIALLNQRWQNLTGANDIKEIRLHYLNGAVDIELCLPTKFINLDGYDEKELYHQYKTALNNIAYIRELKILFG